MSRANEVLACYGELAVTVTRMLELARSRRWDALPALDARCAGLFEELRTMEPPALSPLERSRVTALSDRIDADRVALDALVRPQFTRLAAHARELLRAS